MPKGARRDAASCTFHCLRTGWNTRSRGRPVRQSDESGELKSLVTLFDSYHTSVPSSRAVQLSFLLFLLRCAGTIAGYFLKVFRALQMRVRSEVTAL